MFTDTELQTIASCLDVVAHQIANDPVAGEIATVEERAATIKALGRLCGKIHNMLRASAQTVP